ncbi:centrosomal protein 15 [Scleropages formosus]|uniref:centrosomal protein 15 n=1 Tax=Scleropages formosus TaxID=113540 RepID=UPI000878564C|nr:uncharacterized protein C3orf14 homolog [Scleropages formosus]
MAQTVGPASHLSEEIELSKKHEEIVERRTALLERMEREHERLKSKKKHLEAWSLAAAHERNAQLLGDVQKLQNRLRVASVLHPEVVGLETRYWAFVEENIPEWEPFLLGKAPPPNEAKQEGAPRAHPPPAPVTGLPPPRAHRKRVA